MPDEQIAVVHGDEAAMCHDVSRRDQPYHAPHGRGARSGRYACRHRNGHHRGVCCPPAARVWISAAMTPGSGDAISRAGTSSAAASRVL